MVANALLDTLLFVANSMCPPEEACQRFSRLFRLPRKALVIPSLFIGDNILLTPFFTSLRRRLGENARIDVVAKPPITELYETLPQVNGVYTETPDHAAGYPRLFLKEKRYDTVFLCRYAPVWAMAAMLSGIPQRVGFSPERLGLHGLKRWGGCLTHAVPSTPFFDSRSQLENYLDMLRYLGIPADGKQPACRLNETDRLVGRRLAESARGSPKILVHMASGSPGKAWPAQNWRELLAGLSDMADPVFVAVGSAKERVLYDELAAGVPLLNLCGVLRLRESIALMAHMDMVITLDTATAHMAALAGTPRMVVLYGPTNQRQWRPYVDPSVALEQVWLDLPCRPCVARTCWHKSCMRRMSVPMVMNAVTRCFETIPLVSSRDLSDQEV